MKEIIIEHKYQILFSLFLVLILIGLVFFYQKKELPKVKEDTQISNQIIQDKKEVFQDKKEWYETSIEYPSNNQIIKKAILDNYATFAEDTKILDFKDLNEAKEKLYLSNNSLYTYNAEYTTTTSEVLGEKTTSFIYNIYTYTGGAHGGTNILVFTIDPAGNLIENQKILPDSALPKISKIAFEKVLQEKLKKNSGDGELSAESLKEVQDYISSEEVKTWIEEGVSPKPENYESIALDGESLIIYFGQYQVGPYVEGIYEIKIPYSELK